ncbi:MAG: hypothetical protein BECKG1743D_GA0114223_112171 [Candidatus Kentron sp. G]|nr:MAG: hypothetical protein BECKG1743E_GA0114224_112022 [Candidatus Kentron sp. G]VFN07971.1 MAG: hypothetical protein BECKG1743D_GA0114223_112171 [Candidatus Kentron sp. G]
MSTKIRQSLFMGQLLCCYGGDQGAEDGLHPFIRPIPFRWILSYCHSQSPKKVPFRFSCYEPRYLRGKSHIRVGRTKTPNASRIALMVKRYFPVGNPGKGDIHQFVFGYLEQPAGHPRYVPVGHPVRGTAPEQNNAGGDEVRHVQLPHGLTKTAFQDGKNGIASAEVWDVDEFHVRVVAPGLGNLLRLALFRG